MILDSLFCLGTVSVYCVVIDCISSFPMLLLKLHFFSLFYVARPDLITVSNLVLLSQRNYYSLLSLSLGYNCLRWTRRVVVIRRLERRRHLYIPCLSVPWSLLKILSGAKVVHLCLCFRSPERFKIISGKSSDFVPCRVLQK